MRTIVLNVLTAYFLLSSMTTHFINWNVEIGKNTTATLGFLISVDTTIKSISASNRNA